MKQPKQLPAWLVENGLELVRKTGNSYIWQAYRQKKLATGEAIGAIGAAKAGGGQGRSCVAKI